MEELVVDVLGRGGTDGVAGYIDTDMGASGAEDAHASFNIGVGGIFLTRGGTILVWDDVGLQVFVAHKYGDIDIVDKEETVGVVLEMIFDGREKARGGDGLGWEREVAVHVDLLSSWDVDT